MPPTAKSLSRENVPVRWLIRIHDAPPTIDRMVVWKSDKTCYRLLFIFAALGITGGKTRWKRRQGTCHVVTDFQFEAVFTPVFSKP